MLAGNAFAHQKKGREEGGRAFLRRKGGLEQIQGFWRKRRTSPEQNDIQPKDKPREVRALGLGDLGSAGKGNST